MSPPVRSDREAVELFHLLFLRQLASGTDRTLLTLKGGCNLRFFFGSIRYSEDLDVDVAVLATNTLKNKVDRLLEAPGLALPLKSNGVALTDVSAPKQTETTQRWKLGLVLEGRSVPIRTKIEFSRRHRELPPGVAEVAPVDRAVAQAHGIPPPLLQHYTHATAIEQKIQALLGRPQTQARDVFDLHLLQARGAGTVTISEELSERITEAADRAMSLSYDDYLAQVVAYLDPAQAAPFEDRAAWDAMQVGVVEFLQGLGR